MKDKKMVIFSCFVFTILFLIIVKQGKGESNKYELEVQDQVNLTEFYQLDGVDILARMIFAEARSEPREGRIAVAKIATNRINKNVSGFFHARNLKEVLLCKHGFDGLTTIYARNPMIERKIEDIVAWEECVDIAKNIRKLKNPIGDHLYFVNKETFDRYKVTVGEKINFRFNESEPFNEVISYKIIHKQVFFTLANN